MRLDLAISLGNIIQMGVTVIAVVAAYYRIRERLLVIETKSTPLWEWFDEQARRALHRDERT